VSIIAVILSVATLFPASCYAQKDADAKRVLDRVSQKYKSLKAIEADFSLAMENENAGIQESQIGKIFMQSDMYRIETEDIIRTCDKKSVWTCFIEEEEVQVNEFDPEEGELSPAQLFRIYEEGFKYGINEKESGSGMTVIDLVPEDKDNPYFKIRLSVNNRTNMIDKGVVLEKSGTRYTYNMTNINTGRSFESDFFSLKESDYPGFEWTDLR